MPVPIATTASQRCPWAEGSALLRAFHDHEWGELVTEAAILFEYLVLHTFQIGFNLPVVLKYREAFRELLLGFDPARLARLDAAALAALLANPRMLRNRRKLEATVQNAQAWLRLRQEVGGDEQLLAYFYAYVGGRPLNSQRASPPPLATPLSEALSRDLKRRGFSQTGPATCYAILQTAGLINDHLVVCPAHARCVALATGLAGHLGAAC